MTKLWRSVLMMCALLVAAPAWSADNDYHMGTGDVLRITVYGQPDLTTEARVGDSGNISFPLIGDVKMAGVTPAQGETEIAKRLSKGGFILEPFVTLNVVQYRGQQISVLGRVNRPGKFTLEKVSRVTMCWRWRVALQVMVAILSPWCARATVSPSTATST